MNRLVLPQAPVVPEAKKPPKQEEKDSTALAVRHKEDEVEGEEELEEGPEEPDYPTAQLKGDDPNKSALDQRGTLKKPTAHLICVYSLSHAVSPSLSYELIPSAGILVCHSGTVCVPGNC